MKLIAIVAAALPLLVILAAVANKTAEPPRRTITEESRKATLGLIMHHGVFRPRPTAPKPMHCHISSTGRRVNC